MAAHSTTRLLLALCYLGAVFFGAWHVYQRMQAFEGEIFIVKGREESVVARPSGSFSLAPVQRNMPAEVILFDNPEACRRWFDSHAQYDAVRLPFTLRLDAVTVLEEHPPENRVDVTRPEGKETYAVSVGDRLTIGDVTAEVAAVQPWTGLIRSPGGSPMACFSIRRPAENWTEYLFVDADNWRYLEPSTAVRLRWFRDEETAEARFPRELGNVQSARWGVTEGRAVHWFQSLIPGTGVTLNDGTEVTLLEYEEEHPTESGPRPAILVSVKRGGEEDRIWTSANDTRKNSAGKGKALIRFDAPTRCETVVYFNAWRDNAARVGAFHAGASCGSRILEEGQSWQPSDKFPYELRLDQCMAGAVPVNVADAPIWGVVLQMPSQRVRVREGEAVRVDDAHLRYRRLPVPPTVAYALTATPLHRGGAVSLDLTPNESRRCGDWIFAQKPGNPDAANSASLRATRTLGGPAKHIALFLFAAGSFGLVVVRFRRPPRQSKDIE